MLGPKSSYRILEPKMLQNKNVAHSEILRPRTGQVTNRFLDLSSNLSLPSSSTGEDRQYIKMVSPKCSIPDPVVLWCSNLCFSDAFGNPCWWAPSFSATPMVLAIALGQWHAGTDCLAHHLRWRRQEIRHQQSYRSEIICYDIWYVLICILYTYLYDCNLKFQYRYMISIIIIIYQHWHIAHHRAAILRDASETKRPMALGGMSPVDHELVQLVGQNSMP